MGRDGQVADGSVAISTIDRESEVEIGLVAERMRQTLIEVLGEERGGSMYTMDWLRERVRFHLDPNRCDGEVFLARDLRGAIAGHAIVRVETERDLKFGLFSTFYVAPQYRGAGVGRDLAAAGEAWMRERQVSEARTYTAEDNGPLHAMMRSLGYEIYLRKDDMVAFRKDL